MISGCSIVVAQDVMTIYLARVNVHGQKARVAPHSAVPDALSSSI